MGFNTTMVDEGQLFFRKMFSQKICFNTTMVDEGHVLPTI